MKRFAFRLEKVLELRLYKEKEVELRLAAKEGECMALENLILGLMSRKNQTFKERGQAGMDVNLLLSYENFGRRMDKEIEKNEKILAQKQLEREEIQKEFLEAQSRRKVLDKLKEKKYLAFRQDYKRAEVKILDDLNTSAFLRKQSLAGGILG